MSPAQAIRADRIASDIAALAEITEPDRPYTRRAFSPTFAEGRALLVEWFAAAGLEPRVDVAGNLIGSRAGRAPDKGTIMLGSHSDTVPDGGRFDGIAGVVAALEVARALRDAGVGLDHGLDIVDFLAEEVSVFGVSCIGSRGMVGVRPPEWLAREAGGVSLAEALRRVGGDPARVERRDDISAFLELHIEQGRVLEDTGQKIGVVTAIAGITRIEIVIEGQADHAGTTPMGSRQDALVGAARLVVGIEQAARAEARGNRHFAATVGEFEMWPNAANVVPSRVRLLIDARAEERDQMERFATSVEALAAEAAAATGTRVAGIRRISDNPAVPMHADAVAALEAGAAALGAPSRRMASGAGHDAAFLARAARAGMIFIPCRGGRSHAPDEHAEIADIALGAQVLLEAVLKLDR